MKLKGILSQSLGGIYTFRGYAMYDEIIRLSYPHSGYQRPVDQKHLEEILEFIANGANSFSPEIVLSYTLKYDYSKDGQKPISDPITDIINGTGFKSNVDKVVIKKGRQLEPGMICVMTIPDRRYNTNEDKPFRRVDGNHRLQAIERVIQEGKTMGMYIIPFCIIFFTDDESLKSEKVIFHNINSKAVPIKSEQLLKGIFSVENAELTFSDAELNKDFGTTYSFVRRIQQANPRLILKLKKIDWIGESFLLTVLLDLVNYVEKETGLPINTPEQEEAFKVALTEAIKAGKIYEDRIMISSGLLYLLTLLYYKEEFDSDGIVERTIKSLIEWVQKYDIAALQIHDVNNSSANANCIMKVFEQYILSNKHTIFMSRCFANVYDENERTILRAIEQINAEKSAHIKLERVDRHSEGISGDIFTRIVKGISNSGLVIADFSGGKSNVYHEIGLAMGMKKGFIIIHNGTDEEADQNTPSNLKMHEQIRFSHNDYAKLEREIKQKIIDFYGL